MSDDFFSISKKARRENKVIFLQNMKAIVQRTRFGTRVRWTMAEQSDLGCKKLKEEL